MSTIRLAASSLAVVHSDLPPAQLPGDPPTPQLADAIAALRGHAEDAYTGALEGSIGTVRVPVSTAGPLRLDGANARGEIYIPLATTDVMLVAAIQRGVQALADAGGCATLVLEDRAARTHVIELASVRDASAFAAWAQGEIEAFRRVALAHAPGGRVRELGYLRDGRRVHLCVELEATDDVGDDTATAAIDAVLADARTRSPVRMIAASARTAELARDRRAIPAALHAVRGRNVAAEIVLPRGVVERVLSASPATMVRALRLAAAARGDASSAKTQLAGTLAALFVACGQDLRGLAEAVGTIELDETSTGDLQATLVIPSLLVGTIGGGTRFPQQRACLELLGSPTARGFAEICAATCLAAELSAIAAFASETSVERPTWRERLSPRLRRVLDLLLTGLSEKQIAERTRLSVATTHQYIVEVYRAAGVSSRAQLMATVMRPS